MGEEKIDVSFEQYDDSELLRSISESTGRDLRRYPTRFINESN